MSLFLIGLGLVLLVIFLGALCAKVNGDPFGDWERRKEPMAW